MSDTERRTYRKESKEVRKSTRKRSGKGQENKRT